MTQKIVLIVDDAPENIDIVSSILEGKYKVRAATNGEKALAIAKSANPPDLILLDIMMPGIDGYEVLKRLKSIKSASGIPVIFVTSKNQVADEAYGLTLGAVDYVAKPIAPEVLLARVRTHLELFDSRKELEAQNMALIEAASLREDITRITAHDLKTPLNFMIGGPQSLLDNKGLSDEQREILKRVVSSGFRMLNMINTSLDMFKMEKGTYQLEPGILDILSVSREIINELESYAQAKNIIVEVLVEGVDAGQADERLVMAERLLCYSMLSNLLKNAIEASPSDDTITINFKNVPEMVILIENRGEVPEKIRDSFFGKYVTEGKKSGTGLGTYLAKLAAETQKGSIQLDTSAPGRTCIQVTLPVYDKRSVNSL